MKPYIMFFVAIVLWGLMLKMLVWAGLLPQESWYPTLTMTVACGALLRALMVEDRLDKAGGGE